MIDISFGKVFVMLFQNKIGFIITLPFILNIIFNLAFTPIQFGLKNNVLASIDIVLVLITLVWTMIAIFPFSKWISYLQFPYLLWVLFATILQLSVTYLNYSMK